MKTTNVHISMFSRKKYLILGHILLITIGVLVLSAKHSSISEYNQLIQQWNILMDRVKMTQKSTETLLIEYKRLVLARLPEKKAEIMQDFSLYRLKMITINSQIEECSILLVQKKDTRACLDICKQIHRSFEELSDLETMIKNKYDTWMR